MKKSRGLLALCAGLLCTGSMNAAQPAARIGSKNFTESVILGEALRLTAQRHWAANPAGSPSQGRPAISDSTRRRN